MPSGVVKFFNADRGFGFIKPDDGGADMFVHISACENGVLLREGQRVTYESGTDRKTGKTKALNVQVD